MINTIISETNSLPTENEISQQNLFTELLKSLTNDNANNQESLCLISGDKLEQDYITLQCKHSFNYEALFNEIKAQKCSYNYLETQKLSRNQIKCPYCRSIQMGLIPPRDDYPKIKYVNWPIPMVYNSKTCNAKLKSGKRKGENCNKPCFTKYCKYHSKIISNQKDQETCIAVIKSGKRQGKMCGCKLKSDDNIKYKKCGKHLKINK